MIYLHRRDGKDLAPGTYHFGDCDIPDSQVVRGEATLNMAKPHVAGSFRTGTITITRITEDKVIGTFAGTLCGTDERVSGSFSIPRQSTRHSIDTVYDLTL